ncbi:cyclic peptide transporter [Natronobacillus azotifigens]|uniref:Cyclic peptide export ABC transporter n=1 Tax=Natronobacillus azotifigens TaxID=472978 RepID=A0A9J6R8P3_9BACI|nr:cyclic peptide export ABC transporter [Natronobacillus azotifigens]MCZ0701997.1 cyclic peptide export ABC transporter [Natronobacillus azotifigens]
MDNYLYSEHITEELIKYNNISGVLIYVIAAAILYVIVLASRLLIQVRRGTRQFKGFNKRDLISIVVFLSFIVVIAFSLYEIPFIFIHLELSWQDIFHHGFFNLVMVGILFFVLVGASLLYFYTASYFPRPKEKGTFLLIGLSIVTGIANAMVIFLMNESITRVENYGLDSLRGMIILFSLVLFVYSYSIKILRYRLIKLTNDLVYDKRLEITNKLLHSTYEQLEKLEKEKIYATLNNDTERVGGFVNNIVSAVTSIITVLACFVYLSFIHFQAFVVFLLVLMVLAFVHQKVSSTGERLFLESRDMQNIFFRLIDNMVRGFKELYLHRGRLNDFKADVKLVCDDYRQKRIKADILFTSVVILGELAIFVLMGIIVLVFPFTFASFDAVLLRSFVFVFVFAVGPITSILGRVPELLQIKISWDRINKMAEEVTNLTVDQNKKEMSVKQKISKLELIDVTYVHQNRQEISNSSSFQLGPINLTLQSGEVTYITGGNGSGKTTLAKILTGLYIPSSGRVLVNGEQVPLSTLNEYFAAVFSDYYLFEKLYGIDFKNKENEIQEYLKMFNLEDKVSVRNGKFTTTQLSTGQRKRLALLVSYLDDRPIYILDEWAADQDPQYRAYYYEPDFT